MLTSLDREVHWFAASPWVNGWLLAESETCEEYMHRVPAGQLQQCTKPVQLSENEMYYSLTLLD